MNSVIKASQLSNLLIKNNVVLLTAVRNHWNKDYQPGPYPTTPEQRARAAKKYGIPVDEYEPMKDDGTGCGDYPTFKLVSADAKDPYYPWDYPELRRNFNEVMHPKFDLVREDRYDNSPLRKPMSRLCLEFLCVAGGGALLFLLFENFRMAIPAIPKQYPNKGKTHYTFEVEN